MASNEKEIHDYLMTKIGNRAGVLGLMGNLKAESGLNPRNLENRGNRELGYSDDEYTKLVDDEAYAYEAFCMDKYGYGLAQWTYYTRKANLYNYAKSRNKSIGDLYMQMDFLLSEIKGYPEVWNAIMHSNDIKTVSDKVLLQYERPANQGPDVQVYRANLGKEIGERLKEQTSAAKTIMCAQYHTSLVDALKSVGINHSYQYRKTLAQYNGIKGYRGTAEQNISLLSMLKAGTLVIPGGE